MKIVTEEPIRDPHRFLSRHISPSEFRERAFAFVLRKVDENLAVFAGDSYPAPASEHNVYGTTGNVDWTPAFWTGLLWLAYEMTGEKKYRKAAEAQLPGYRRRLDEGIGTDTHDLGFLYTLSCVAAHRLTGNEAAREIAIRAADLLLKRYDAKAGIIQAWGRLDDPQQRGRIIIDCAMNLPLLYWTSEETGDSRYHDAAARHVERANANLIREDASTYHTYFFDLETGLPLCGTTAQGASDLSCWSRGQAWGIYGLPLSYRYLGTPELLAMAKKLANYFLNRLPDDLVCYWDLVFTSGTEERDSSAAAIAACGLRELAAALPAADPDRAVYEKASSAILASLAETYTSADEPGANGILRHGVYDKPGGKGVDECLIWGDYFYAEALVRCLKPWQPYW